MAIVNRPRTLPPDIRQSQQRVLRRLDVVRRRLRWHLLVEGLFWLVTATVGLAAVSLVLDRLLRFERPARLALLVVMAAALVWVFVRRLLLPVCVRLDNLDLAEVLDRRAPGVGQRITNVLQLPDLLADGHLASPSLVHASVIECAQALDQVDMTATLNAPRRRKLFWGMVGLVALVGLLCLWSPQVASLWARRWLGGSNVRWPQATYLSVVGVDDAGRLLVPRGELSLVQIGARPKFTRQDQSWLLAGRDAPLVVESADEPSSNPPEQVSISYSLPESGKRRGNATQFDEATFRYELPPLAEPIELDIVGGDDWLGPIRIEPIDRPAIATLEIGAQPPGNGKPSSVRVDEGQTQLLYLAETKLELRLQANQPISAAEVLDKGTALSGLERVDDRTFVLRWTMADSLALEFRLTGRQGGLVSKPYFLAIGLLKDREPRVTIRSSGVGRRVTPVARIPLAVRATDDFGLASMALEWERATVTEGKPQVDTGRLAKDQAEAGEQPTTLGTEVEWNHELQLRELKVAPGQALKLRGAATDACTVGPQAGQSRWLLFQVVASDELFYEVLMRQREQRAKFTLALESMKAQAKTLEEMTRPDEALGVSRAVGVVVRQVGQITVQLEASLEEMTLNDLGNEQSRENMQTAIITPLRSLHADLLGQLRQAVDSLGRQPELSDQRRGEAQALAQQAVESMQAILAQMSLWESFIDVVNQLKQIIERQDQLLKATEDIDKKRTDSLFDE